MVSSISVSCVSSDDEGTKILCACVRIIKHVLLYYTQEHYGYACNMNMDKKEQVRIILYTTCTCMHILVIQYKMKEQNTNFTNSLSSICTYNVMDISHVLYICRYMYVHIVE